MYQNYFSIRPSCPVSVFLPIGAIRKAPVMKQLSRFLRASVGAVRLSPRLCLAKACWPDVLLTQLSDAIFLFTSSFSLSHPTDSFFTFLSQTVRCLINIYVDLTKRFIAKVPSPMYELNFRLYRLNNIFIYNSWKCIINIL